MITKNNTLPEDWKPAVEYHYGDRVYYGGIIYKCIADSTTGDNPGISENRLIWEPIDIYKKDATVMDDKNYSGDESLWERDQFAVDPLTGDVYINGENTGINVKGPAGSVTINYESLTPEQREALKGAKGDIGPQGPQGIQGVQGPPGEVEWESLTPEQRESLKGDQGLSAYEVWLTLPGNEGKSEYEFIQDITGPGITVDTAVSPTSRNPVENRAIYNYIHQYDLLIEQLSDRIDELERRLSYIYHGEKIDFKFGVTADGEYGYIKQGTQQVIPFHLVDQPQLFSTFAENAHSVLDGSIGINSVPEVENTVLNSVNTDLHPTSLSNSSSRSVGASDGNTLYATNIQPMSFEEAFNTKIYLLRNGEFERYQKPGVDMDGMTYVTGSNPTSNGIAGNEGLWTDLTAGHYTSRVYFKVKPTTANQTIQYKIGTFTTEQTSLNNIISHGTVVKQGTFNEETLISIDIVEGQGFYFASVNSSPSYQIVEIYFS